MQNSLAVVYAPASGDGAAAIMPQAVSCVTRRTIRTCVRLTRKRGAGYTSQRGSNMAGRGKHR